MHQDITGNAPDITDNAQDITGHARDITGVATWGKHCHRTMCNQFKHGGTEFAVQAAAAYQTDAGANPRTVMIKLFHTIVTNGAVGAAGRSPMVAGGAPLGLHHIAVYLMVLVSRPASACNSTTFS